MNQHILEIGNSLVNHLHLKSILRPLYYKLFKSKSLKKQKSLFDKNAKEALSCFDNCLRQEGIRYSLAFGTMLGAVREHGFIKHDIDIDTMMWSDDYVETLPEILGKYGFRHIHSFLVENGALGREETYEYKGVQIDIFFVYPPVSKYPYCCDFIQRDCLTFESCMKKYGSLLPRRIELPFSREITYGKFEDMLLPIPANADEILAFRYGSDYMTPNPKWSVRSNNEHIVEWSEQKGVFIHYS